MIQLTIDDIIVKVPESTTVLEAARTIGIKIPTMCFEKGFQNRPSCMICIVKDKKTDNLFPSCTMLVDEGMIIVSNDSEIKETRKEALELLLSDHVGDCEAPCRISCPAFMDIPLMNRLIAKSKYAEALKIVKKEIALPLILGHICPAPCEIACRRKQVDNPVSICLLKKFVAAEDNDNKHPHYPIKAQTTNKKVAIIGTGPAGLASAFHILKLGHSCVLFDKNEKAGGSLRSVSAKELPGSIIDEEIESIRKFGAEFKLNTLITKEIFKADIRKNFDTVIIACGDIAKSNIKSFGFRYTKSGVEIEPGTFKTGLEGVFACGSVVRPQKMAVSALAQGKAAAISAGSFLNGHQQQKRNRKFNSKFGNLFPLEIEEYLKESIDKNRTDPKKGILNGFSVEEAILEAKRCLHCDCRKLDNCKLRNLSDEYKADRKRFLFGERKIIKKYFQHETVVYEPEKCIKCRLCVEITHKECEPLGLTEIGRGFDIQINVPFGKNLKEALTISAEKCVKSCPTGALAFK